MKILIKIIVLLSVVSISFLNANEDVILNDKVVDCIILKDENSIICKYTHERINEDKEVVFNWIEPNGNVTRNRTMTIPAGHGSVYDFRYIQGRIIGEWTLEVIDLNTTYKTNFFIE